MIESKQRPLLENSLYDSLHCPTATNLSKQDFFKYYFIVRYK